MTSCARRGNILLTATMILFATSLLVLLLQLGSCEDCEPVFADTCFTSVTGDLKFMLNLKNMVAVNVTQEAVHDLCLALDDALNCTSEIIDTDCNNTDGRSKFDSWLRALRGAYNNVCGNNHQPLRDILRGIQCWSIEDFMLCSEEILKLTHVEDLLNTEIDDVECENLRTVTAHCWREANTQSCREQEDITHLVGNMISSFFQESDCDIPEPISRGTVWTASSMLLSLLLLVL